MLNKAIQPLGVKKNLADVVQVDKERLEVENLVKNCNYKTCIGLSLNCLITLSLVPTYPLFNFSVANLLKQGYRFIICWQEDWSSYEDYNRVSSFSLDSTQ